MARRGGNNEDLSNVEFETSEDVEVVPTFNSMVSIKLVDLLVCTFVPQCKRLSVCFGTGCFAAYSRYLCAA